MEDGRSCDNGPFQDQQQRSFSGPSTALSRAINGPFQDQQQRSFSGPSTALPRAINGPYQGQQQSFSRSQHRSMLLTALMINFSTMVALMQQNQLLDSLKRIYCAILQVRRIPRPWHATYRQPWYSGLDYLSNTEFKANFRIEKRTFVFLCERLHAMRKKDTKLRKSISLEKRVALALYNLSSSCEYRTIGHLFGVSKASVCIILNEFCQLVKDVLMQDFIEFPTTEEQILNIVAGFKNDWGFPQCVGSIDGTHIKIQPPKEQAFAYYCYKSFYSVVLLAACDYAYRFTFISVGTPGRNNDAYVYNNSMIYDVMSSNAIFTQLSRDIASVSVPVFLIGDSAFPLQKCMMKPYPELASMSQEKRYFNYRLARARRVIENAFGRLKARFRILKLLELQLRNSITVIEACCVLNNICEVFGDKIESSWLADVDVFSDDSQQSVAGERDAIPTKIRDALCTYFKDN